MDIKPKAHILKTRAKELGYEIKLTHAQEMVASIFGHQSRHSALIADNSKKQSIDFNLLQNLSSIIELCSDGDTKGRLTTLISKIKESETENNYSDSQMKTPVDFATVGLKAARTNAKKYMQLMNEADFKAVESVKFQTPQDKEFFEGGMKLGRALALNNFYGLENIEKWLDNLKTAKALSPVNRVLKETLNNFLKSKFNP